MRSFSANRRFAPSLVGVVLVVVGIAVFGSLGRWQLQRAEEKRALLSAYTDGERRVINLNAATESPPRYQRVQVSGHYDSQHQILLDNMPSAQGRAGYRVLTPFAIANGMWILVDRGWIPTGANRSVLPDVSVGEEPRRIIGRTDRLPRPGLRLETPPMNQSAPWPRVLTFPEHPTLEQALQRPLAPYIVLLDADQADGFERQWSARLPVGPDRHIAYAVQWFALAVAGVVIFAVVSYRRNPPP